MKNKIHSIMVSMTFIAVMLFASTSSEAQSTPVPDNKNADWQELYHDSNIIVFYHAGICNGSDAVYLKFENKSDEDLSVSWSLWDSAENKNADLSSKSTRTGECSSAGDFKLIDFMPPGQSANTISPKFVVTVKLK